MELVMNWKNLVSLTLFAFGFWAGAKIFRLVLGRRYDRIITAKKAELALKEAELRRVQAHYDNLLQLRERLTK